MSGEPAPDEVAVRIRGLSTGFGDLVVHDNLDLDVRRGEILGVVGGSGSGKSVLMRVILGLLAPRAGRIEVFGDCIDSQGALDRVRRRTGVLFQDGALFSSLTVRENVEVPIATHFPNMPAEVRSDVARLKIRLVGLPVTAATLYPAELSGGMRKRSGLARALAIDPELLFLDEPTAGLDPIGASEFDELLMTLKQALGLTVFLITHDLDTLYRICDRVAVIGDRRILVVGSLSEVESFDHEWIEQYFHGPRARAASRAGGR